MLRGHQDALKSARLQALLREFPDLTGLLQRFESTVDQSTAQREGRRRLWPYVPRGAARGNRALAAPERPRAALAQATSFPSPAPTRPTTRCRNRSPTFTGGATSTSTRSRSSSSTPCNATSSGNVFPYSRTRGVPSPLPLAAGRTSNLATKDVGGDVFQLEVPKSVSVPASFMPMSATSVSNRGSPSGPACVGVNEWMLRSPGRLGAPQTVKRFWTPELKTLAVEYAEANETRLGTPGTSEPQPSASVGLTDARRPAPPLPRMTRSNPPVGADDDHARVLRGLRRLGAVRRTRRRAASCLVACADGR